MLMLPPDSSCTVSIQVIRPAAIPVLRSFNSFWETTDAMRSLTGISSEAATFPSELPSLWAAPCVWAEVSSLLLLPEPPHAASAAPMDTHNPSDTNFVIVFAISRSPFSIIIHCFVIVLLLVFLSSCYTSMLSSSFSRSNNDIVKVFATFCYFSTIFSLIFVYYDLSNPISNKLIAFSRFILYTCL